MGSTTTTTTVGVYVRLNYFGKDERREGSVGETTVERERETEKVSLVLSLSLLLLLLLLR